MLKHARNQVGKMVNFPAAFRRLCVETFMRMLFKNDYISSRLQAAVC